MKIGIFSDMHIGHKVGLCPPEWWGGGAKVVSRLSQRWSWFLNSLHKYGPLDAIIICGDTVDGTGVKNVQETIIPNLGMQVDAAVEVIEQIKKDMTTPYRIHMVYGTPVHTTTGDGYELEGAVARKLDVEIHGQIWLNVHGYVIDIRHHPAGSSTVYPGNPLQKEREANVRWWMEGVQPKADIIVRGHTHRMYVVSEPNRWMGIACPALQDLGTVYGRRLSNVVHMGWGILEITNEEWPTWTVYEAPRIKEIALQL